MKHNTLLIHPMGNCFAAPPPPPLVEQKPVAPPLARKETMVDIRLRKASAALRLWSIAFLTDENDEAQEGYVIAAKRYEEALDAWYDQEIARCGNRYDFHNSTIPSLPPTP